MLRLPLRRAVAASVIVLSAASAAHAVLLNGIKVAVEGETLTNSDGLTVASTNTPFTNSLGEVAFAGVLANPPVTGLGGFVFVKNQIVHKNYAVTPPPTVSGVESTVGLTDAGDWIFSPSIDGEDGVYTNNGPLLRGTDAAPGRPGEFITFASRPTASADNFYWVSGTATSAGGASTRRVLYKSSPGPAPSITPVIAGGDVVGGLTLAATGIDFDYKISDNNAHSIMSGTFTGQTTGTDTATFIDGQTIVAREGSQVVGGNAGENWTSVSRVSINNAGNWTAAGDTTAATTQDQVLIYNNTVAMREGQVVNGITLGSAVNAVSLNNSNQMAVIWNTTLPTSETLFFGDPSNPASFFKLATEGDTLDFNGDSVADFTITDMSASAAINEGLDIAANGIVYFEATITPIGGTTAVDAVIGIAVPEPGSAIALLSLGALGMIRRRRGR